MNFNKKNNRNNTRDSKREYNKENKNNNKKENNNRDKKRDNNSKNFGNNFKTKNAKTNKKYKIVIKKSNKLSKEIAKKEDVKLQKFIANSGMCSRRKAEELITNGHFTINGVVAKLGDRVTGNEKILYKGRPIIKDEKEYYLINKPLEYICSSKEQFGRPIVIDLIKTKARLVTCGRLDMYTTGAILVTNDGDLINHLTHPSKKQEKEYYVTIKGEITEEDLNKLRTGVEIDMTKHIEKEEISTDDLIKNGNKYLTKRAKAAVLGYNKEKDEQRISLTIIEGKNRQVRRMFKELGYSVLALHRHRFANLDVKNLKPGNYRQLTNNEINELYNS